MDVAKTATLKYASIKQLVDAAEKNVPKQTSAIKCKIFYSTAEQMYSMAEAAKKKGDLENAFIYFYRYGSIAMHLIKAPDYSQIHYPMQTAHAISEAEIIRIELMKLYDTKNRAVLVSTDTESSVADPQDQQRTVKQVHELLSQHKCLLIDLRDEGSFEESHVKTKFVYNLPIGFLKPSMKPAELEEVLQNTCSYAFFAERSSFEYVVIMDSETRNPFHAGVPDNHPMRLMYKLLAGNSEKKLKRSPVMLSGGFRLWLASYPHMTTNPRPRNEESKPSIPFANAGQVSYPSLDFNPAPSAPSPIRRDKPPISQSGSRILSAKPATPQATDKPVPLPRSHSLSDIEQSNTNLPKPRVDRASKPLNDIHSVIGNSRTDNFSFQNETTSGLKNLGNTCYMNATLQCLAHTRIFVRYFIDGSYRDELNRDSAHGSKGRLPEIMQELFCDMFYQKYNNALTKFMNLMGELFSAYSTHQQQDAHEFLLNVLNTLHEDLNRAPKRNIKASSESPNITEKNVVIALNSFFEQHQDRHCSIVSDTFEGILMSQLECVTCKNSSYTFEVFSVLSLPIPQEDGTVTLDDCFRDFFKIESITEQIWDCPHCKAKRNAEKHLRIARLPKTLVLQFVRFKHDKGYYGSEKITQFVKFENTIRLDRHLDNKTQPKSKSYSLFGFVNHTGNLAAGHYTAFCRNSADRWHKYDDSIVTPFIPSDVEKQAAYMAFYMSN